jgi:integrase
LAPVAGAAGQNSKPVTSLDRFEKISHRKIKIIGGSASKPSQKSRRSDCLRRLGSDCTLVGMQEGVPPKNLSVGLSFLFTMQHYFAIVAYMEANQMTPSILKNVVRMPKQRAKQVRSRISYLSSEQLERFLQAAKEFGPREHAMFLFAVAHGARVQEIANLRVSDINFNNEQIHVARLKGSLDSTQNLLKVKGNALFDEKAALKAWLAVREPDADNFVFNSQKSTQLNRVTVYKLFKQIAKKAGLGETLQHPHVLKHTAAMLMVQQGANAFLIRQHLGHRSFDSTLAYVNPSDADASAASAKAFSQVF